MRMGRYPKPTAYVLAALYLASGSVWKQAAGALPSTAKSCC